MGAFFPAAANPPSVLQEQRANVVCLYINQASLLPSQALNCNSELAQLAGIHQTLPCDEFLTGILEVLQMQV